MKKIFALALAVIMVMGSFPAVFAEEAPVENINTADVQKEEYIKDLIGMADGGSDDAAFLSEYAEVIKNIYPEYKEYAGFEEKVSRQDFLLALVNIIYGKNYPAYTLFADVSPENKALLDCLGCAIKLGMISPSDTFRPDDAISYGEMYKMAVVALGYNMLANQYGGWPAGYMFVASKTGLTQNVEFTDGEVSAKDALTVLYNVITLEFMEQTSFGETEMYTVAVGKSILSERYGIELIEGVVNADDSTSITDADAALSRDEIVIGTKTYKNSSGKSLLGYRVKAYVRAIGNKEEIISIHKYENREVFADDFDFIGTDKVRVMQADGKNKDYSIYRGYSAVLNNVAAPYIDLTDYEGRDDVTLYIVDNNNDGIYDVVKIYDWDYMQIGKIDTINRILFDKNAPGVYSDGRVKADSSLNLDATEVITSIYNCTGSTLEKVNFESLQADDIITYAISDNGKSVVIFKSAAKIVGVLDEYNPTDKKMLVGGNEYELTSYADGKFSSFILGENITLYLDATGRIIAFTQTDDDFLYAYMIAVEKGSGLDSSYRAKLFNQNGNMEILNVSEDIYIDNVRKKASDLDTIDNGLADDERMIKYSINGDEEIFTVDFAEAANPLLPFTESKPERNSFTLYYDDNLERLGDGSFGTSFMADNSTKIFQIPKSAQYKNDESYYLIKSHNDYRNGYMDIKAYDMAPGEGPKVILYFTDAQTIKVDEYTGSVVFLGATDGINADGEACKLMTTYTGSAYKKNYVDPSVDISGLIPGDIIAISVYQNEVIDMVLHYSYSTNAITAPSSPYCRFYKGYIYAYGNRMLQLWDSMNINNQVNISDILGLDFREQSVTFIDLYKDSNGRIYKAMARYKPISEIKDYLSNGTDADFLVARMSGSTYQNKWIYRIIER